MSDNKLNFDSSNFDFSKFYDCSIKLEEKVTDSIFLLNSFKDYKQEVTDIFNKLKMQKTNLINLYEIIFSKIKQEILLLLDEIFEGKLKNIQLEKKMDHISRDLRFNEAVKDLNSSDLLNTIEYKNFLNNYEENLVTSQEIVQKKMKICKLLESQKLLDKSYSEKIVEIDLQIMNFDHLFEQQNNIVNASSSTVTSARFNGTKEFEEMIMNRDQQFDAVKLKLEYQSTGLFDDKYKKNISDFISLGK